MGYYTHFDLEIGRKIRDDGFEERLTREEMDSITEYLENTEDFQYYLGGESVKGYGWDADFKELSRKFPNALFILKGEGEEAGDLWKAYFLNGKSQVAEAVVTFPPFDPDLLSD